MDPMLPRPPPGEEDSSLELLRHARNGDPHAADRLCARYLPRLNRWATGRLPHSARDLLDTNDLVLEALRHTLTRAEAFDPSREGAFQAHLRRAVLDRIQQEVRKTGPSDPGPSPLEEAVGRELLGRYEAALERLQPGDREAVVVRVEMALDYDQVAEALGKPSIEAAQMAVSRALVQLAREMGRE